MSSATLQAKPVMPSAEETHSIRSGTTDVSDLVEILRAGLKAYSQSEQREANDDPQRREALAVYRNRLTDHFRRDLDCAIRRIEDLAEHVARTTNVDLLSKPVIRDGFERLARLSRFIRETDMFESSAIEEKYWIAIQQFHYDAIDLTERILDVEAGRRRILEPMPRSDGTFKRFEFLGIESYRPVQAVLNALEVAVPNSFEMRFWKTLWPSLAHMLWHQFIPWGELSWCDFERTTLGWLREDGFAKLRGDRGAVVRFDGIEAFERNSDLFDQATGKTNHNVIIAASHRAGFLDFPLFGAALKNTPHAIWLNNSFYTPGMARKLARGRTTVTIRGLGRTSMKEALDLSVRIVAEDCLPTLIIADGSQPNMMYGYQVRVKRGVRVLVDECIRRTQGQGRRTFVVPLTFDDPLGYLCGLDKDMVTTLHPPIEVVSPSTEEPYRSVFDENAINGGDDLLNHLEALYLTNCLQARHPLRPTDVVETVRRRRQAQCRWGPRALLQSIFNTSVFDLSRTRR